MLSGNETKRLSILNHVLSFHTEEVRRLGQGAVPHHLPPVKQTEYLPQRGAQGDYLWVSLKQKSCRSGSIYCLPCLQMC